VGHIYLCQVAGKTVIPYDKGYIIALR